MTFFDNKIKFLSNFLSWLLLVMVRFCIQDSSESSYQKIRPYQTLFWKRKTYFLNTGLDRFEIIGTSSFTTYLFNHTDKSSLKGYYDAINTFVLVRSSTIYAKSFIRPWYFMTSEKTELNLQMHQVLSFGNTT